MSSSSDEMNFFQKGKVLVSNGGMGSRLMQYGFDIGTAKLWSGEVLLTQPEAVKKVHTEFIDAKADIILTDTYHCCLTVMRTTKGLTQQQCDSAFDSAFKMARDAVAESKRRVFIGGSVGPYAVRFSCGMEYHGKYMKTSEPKDIEDYYREQIKAVASRKPDLLCLETIPSVKEAEIAVRVLEELKVGLPTWVAFQCRTPTETGSGEKIEDAARLVEGSTAVHLMGINCCPPGILVGAVKTASDAGLTKGFAVYPNSGEVWVPEIGFSEFHKSSDMMKPQDVARDVLKFDVRVIGGCCRVEPSDIAEVREIVDSMTV